MLLFFSISASIVFPFFVDLFTTNGKNILADIKSILLSLLAAAIMLGWPGLFFTLRWIRGRRNRLLVEKFFAKKSLRLQLPKNKNHPSGSV